MLLRKSQTIKKLNAQIDEFEMLSQRIVGITSKDKKQIQNEILLLMLLAKQARNIVQEISEGNENSKYELYEIKNTIKTLKELQEVIGMFADVCKAQNEMEVRCNSNDDFAKFSNHIPHYAC